MAQRIFLIKQATTTKYAVEITNIGSFSYSLNTPVSPLPLPEESHEENVLVKMEGNSAQINIDFKITQGSKCFGTVTGNQGNRNFTASGGSSGRPPLYIINEIKNNFIPKSLTDAYYFEVQDDDGNHVVDSGTISSISFSVSADSPVVYNCSLTFMVGNVIGLYEANVPYPPQQVFMSKTSSTTIQLNWVISKVYSSSTDVPTITGTSIKYKASDSPVWVEYTGTNSDGGEYALGNGGESTTPADNSNTSITLVLPSNKTYRIKVAQLSNNSDESNVFYYSQAKVVIANTTPPRYSVEITL